MPEIRPASRHRLRLLAYLDSLEVGGAEISLGNLLSALGQDVDAGVLGVHRPTVDAVADRREGCPRSVVPPARSKWDARAMLAHARALRAFRPDVLHVSLRTPWTCQAAILAGVLLPGVRVVAVEQLPLPSEDRLQQRLKRLLALGIDAHVAVGERAARLVEEYAGLRPGSVISIPNGVPEAELERIPPFECGPVIGSLGRLDVQKGYDLLVRTLPALPEARLLLVGDGPKRGELETLAVELGVRDRLEITGWMTDARRYLTAMDVFALPSRYEGLPLSIIEAMLAGLPVVAADVGSVSEAVVDGETGLIVPPEDVGALAGALGRLAADGDLRQKMGGNGLARARERFTAEAMAGAYERLYNSLLA